MYPTDAVTPLTLEYDGRRVPVLLPNDWSAFSQLLSTVEYPLYAEKL
jgi:hypothetical protein